MPVILTRQSQVVMGMGPGAMADFPNDAVIIGGLDQWSYPYGQIPVVEEPRLVGLLRVILDVPELQLRKPPAAVNTEGGFHPAITVYRFPQWVLVQPERTSDHDNRRRRLVHTDALQNGKYRERDGKLRTVVPIRFVRACPKGHVGDIDWPAFVHGAGHSCHRDLWMVERGTSGDLNDVWVVCECGEERPMSQAARRELRALGFCDGARPWLGAFSRERCTEPSRLLIRSASNSYFPQTLSVISIPETGKEIDVVVNATWDGGLSIVTGLEMLKMVRTIPNMKPHLEPFSDDEILEAIQRKKDGAEALSGSVKENEFVALAAVKQEIGSDAPDGDFYARALPPSKWNADWMAPVERVVLVHRLREVVAQVGFTRFEAVAPDINGDLDLDVSRAPLGLNVSWLPAVENRGEGVFLQFRPKDVAAWFQRTAVLERARELSGGFDLWKKDHPQTKRLFPGPAYVMLHSLSHLLITSIALECGYPASSLRERIYAGEDQYGILIYTGASDSEGTLGGLVQAGRQIKRHMRRALQMGALCSNDPVCAHQRPVSHEQLHLLGSACHGCLLIAETSCEQRNDYLDRSLVVPTLADCGAEFFGALT
jgi:hypothetical protein